MYGASTRHDTAGGIVLQVLMVVCCALQRPDDFSYYLSVMEELILAERFGRRN
jgi:hypothetical protein